MTDICTLQLPRGARRAQSNCAETTTCTESTDGRAEVGVGGRDSSGDAIQRPMSRTAQKKARRQRRQASAGAATDAVAATAEPEPQVELSDESSDERQAGTVVVPSPMSRTALKKARRQRRKELAAAVANAGETAQ